MFNVVSSFVVLCIATCLVVRLFGNISHVALEPYQHVCVYFGSFERLDGYGISQSADNGKYINIDFCGINESLVSENAA